MNIKDLIRIALWLVMVLTLQFLTVIPNVSFTYILLILYIRNNKFYNNLILIISYVLLLNVIYGFSIFTIFQLLSYSILLIYTIYNINIIRVGLTTLVCMVVYYPLGVYLYGVSYIINDWLFTLILTINNVLLYMWVYPILERIYKGVK